MARTRTPAAVGKLEVVKASITAKLTQLDAFGAQTRTTDWNTGRETVVSKPIEAVVGETQIDVSAACGTKLSVSVVDFKEAVKLASTLKEPPSNKETGVRKEIQEKIVLPCTGDTYSTIDIKRVKPDLLEVTDHQDDEYIVCLSLKQLKELSALL